jgi:hypothetical protein
MKEELRMRLTKLFQMMAWAHRDLDQWGAVRRYIASFPPVERDIANPLYHEMGYGSAKSKRQGKTIRKESSGEMWY